MAPARKTRSKPALTAAEIAQAAAVTSTTQITPLAPIASNPPKLFILPKDVSSEARIVSLSNPKTGKQTRYFCCPQKGFFEFTKVAAPKTTPRSWLLSPAIGDGSVGEKRKRKLEVKEEGVEKGYVMKSADLFVATPMDPLFLILPALCPSSTKADQKGLFLEADEYIDILATQSPHLRPLLEVPNSTLRQSLESRISAVSEMILAGDVYVFRFSLVKLLHEIMDDKAARIINKGPGLPASMEQKLVKKVLEPPMLSLKRGEDSMHELAEEEDARESNLQDKRSSEGGPGLDAPTMGTSVGDSVNKVIATEKTGTPTINAPDGVLFLQRLHTAFTFITNSYLQPHLAATLNTLIMTPPSYPETISLGGMYQFNILTQHLARISALRQQALLSRSTSDFSLKRSLDEDEEAGEGRAEKKRRKEEEEKKAKAGMSRGVKDLKKVNVQGMKKMSDFFKKK